MSISLLKPCWDNRPTATEFYHYIAETGTGFSKIQKHYSGWYDLLSKESDLDKLETDTSLIHQDFLVQGVEKASMSKCFKMVLLNAFLELDGFINPPTTKVLADKSWHLLKRHPVLFASELPENNSPWLETMQDGIATGRPIQSKLLSRDKIVFSKLLMIDLRSSQKF